MSGSYDFEEQERIAELKAWWEDNRWYVIGAIIAALAAFAIFRGWQFWSARAETTASTETAIIGSRTAVFCVSSKIMMTARSGARVTPAIIPPMPRSA